MSGAKEAGTEVRAGQTSSLRGGNVELGLEMAIEDVKKAIRKAPVEEQDCGWIDVKIMILLDCNMEIGYDIPRQQGMSDCLRLR